MRLIETRELTMLQREDIRRLWNAEYPETLQYAGLSELEDYLHKLADKKYYMLVNENNVVMGWAFSFVRDKERWFAIILHKDIQGKGYGTQLLDTMKANEAKLNGWVMDHNNAIKAGGEVYRSPLRFYIKNGFEVCGDIRIENEKISAVKIRWGNVVNSEE